MTEDQLRDIHGDRDALLQALRDAGANVKGPGRIVCPFHEDRNPSGTTYQGEDGAWRFKCLGCGVCEDVIGVKALVQGRSAGDVLTADHDRAARPPRIAKPVPPPRVFADLAEIRRAVPFVKAMHAYTHPTTSAIELVVVRSEPAGEKKRFVQCRPIATGGFEMKAPAAPLPIYNRTRLAAATGTVIVVEGEKCVEALTRLGYVATTSPGGADKGHKAEWSPLAGKPDVVLWPDQDAPDKDGVRKGHRHMRAVADPLERLDPPPTVRWFDPAPFDLPVGGDAVDFITMFGGSREENQRRAVDCAIEDATPMGGASDLDQLIEDTIAARRAVVPLPWQVLDRLSQALVPGTITCVCGDSGSSKSLWLTEAGMYWPQHNVKVAIFMLEEDRAYHLDRALAQLANNADLTDMRWVRTNPEAGWRSASSSTRGPCGSSRGASSSRRRRRRRRPSHGRPVRRRGEQPDPRQPVVDDHADRNSRHPRPRPRPSPYGAQRDRRGVYQRGRLRGVRGRTGRRRSRSAGGRPAPPLAEVGIANARLGVPGCRARPRGSDGGHGRDQRRGEVAAVGAVDPTGDCGTGPAPDRPRGWPGQHGARQAPRSKGSMMTTTTTTTRDSLARSLAKARAADLNIRNRLIPLLDRGEAALAHLQAKGRRAMPELREFDQLAKRFGELTEAAAALVVEFDEWATRVGSPSRRW